MLKGNIGGTPGAGSATQAPSTRRGLLPHLRFLNNFKTPGRCPKPCLLLKKADQNSVLVQCFREIGSIDTLSRAVLRSFAGTGMCQNRPPFVRRRTSRPPLPEQGGAAKCNR